MWFIGVEVEQESSAPPPKKNPRSAPVAEKNQPGISQKIKILCDEYKFTLHDFLKMKTTVKLSSGVSLKICAKL